MDSLRFLAARKPSFFESWLLNTKMKKINENVHTFYLIESSPSEDCGG